MIDPALMALDDVDRVIGRGTVDYDQFQCGGVPHQHAGQCLLQNIAGVVGDDAHRESSGIAPRYLRRSILGLALRYGNRPDAIHAGPRRSAAT